MLEIKQNLIMAYHHTNDREKSPYRHHHRMKERALQNATVVSMSPLVYYRQRREQVLQPDSFLSTPRRQMNVEGQRSKEQKSRNPCDLAYEKISPIPVASPLETLQRKMENYWKMTVIITLTCFAIMTTSFTRWARKATVILREKARYLTFILMMMIIAWGSIAFLGGDFWRQFTIQYANFSREEERCGGDKFLEGTIKRLENKVDGLRILLEKSLRRNQTFCL